jgi:hypothetical protein
MNMDIDDYERKMGMVKRVLMKVITEAKIGNVIVPRGKFIHTDGLVWELETLLNFIDPSYKMKNLSEPKRKI